MTRTASPADLIALFRERLADRPAWLRAHTARVVHEARRLARRHELDVERAAAGAWGHDLFRHCYDGELLRHAAALRLAVGPAEAAAPILLHGPVAAGYAEREWGVGNAEVLEAIHWHTTARPGMSALALAVFVADKIEPAKVADDPGLQAVRTLADADLPAAALLYLERQIARHLHEGHVVATMAMEARNALLVEVRARG